MSKDLVEEKAQTIYLKGDAVLNGLSVPTLVSIGKRLGALISDEGPNMLMALWKSGSRPERLVCIAALEPMVKVRHKEVKEFLLRIIGDISTWEECDQLALRVVRWILLKEGSLSLLREWVSSKDKWIRRLAFASIPPYLRVNGDAKACLDLLEENLEEKDKDVKKAMAWAIREICKRNPDLGRRFVERWKGTWLAKEGMKKLPGGAAYDR